MSPPSGVATADRILTKFGIVGQQMNIITQAIFEVCRYIIVTLTSVKVSCFSNTTADVLCAACDNKNKNNIIIIVSTSVSYKLISECTF